MNDRDRGIEKLRRVVDEFTAEHLGGEPEWGPLEAAIPIEWCGGFMWMHRTEQDGEPIEVYKHGITRRSLHLDHKGRAYRYSVDGYLMTTLDSALANAFEGLEEMGWTRATRYDEDFIRAKHEALRKMGYTVISAAPLGDAE